MHVEFGMLAEHHAPLQGRVRCLLTCRGQETAAFDLKELSQDCQIISDALIDLGEEPCAFWYELAWTGGSRRVARVMLPSQANEAVGWNLRQYLDGLEARWLAHRGHPPAWFSHAVNDLLGPREGGEFIRSCDDLLDRLKSAEFHRLVEEVKPLGFSHSCQVSKYIVKRRLGLRYKYISGHLRMMRGDSSWDFVGGIAPEWYRKLCEELKVVSLRTDAEPVEFESFSEVREAGRNLYQRNPRWAA